MRVWSYLLAGAEPGDLGARVVNTLAGNLKAGDTFFIPDDKTGEPRPDPLVVDLVIPFDRIPVTQIVYRRSLNPTQKGHWITKTDTPVQVSAAVVPVPGPPVPAAPD